MEMRIIIVGICTIISCMSCQDEWLGAKPDQKLVVPATLKDLRALLDNTRVMQAGYPVIGEMSADDYYIPTNSWNSLATTWEKNTYIWKSDIYEDNSIKGVTDDWAWPYQRIYYSNLVLEKLKLLSPTTSVDVDEHRRIQGTALFQRAWAFYQISQLFCEQYDPAIATSQLGIPIRLESDISIKSTRATLSETLEQIVADLSEAEAYLPALSEKGVRPGKAAVLALLARVYLSMCRYDKALDASERCLALQDDLMDFSKVDGSRAYPFLPDNVEVIYRNIMSSSAIFRGTCYVSRELVESYDDTDLRKGYFYRMTPQGTIYRGSYEGGTAMFAGLTTSEVYLIKAECQYRQGKKAEAMTGLFELLRTRDPNLREANLADETDLLQRILLERRKELVFRGVRWGDLKRLNREGTYATTLRRQLDDDGFDLPPASKNWTLPIPQIVVDINGMTQNSRQ